VGRRTVLDRRDHSVLDRSGDRRHRRRRRAVPHRQRQCRIRAHAEFGLEAGFASNGFGEHSPGGYSLSAAIAAEVILTFFFLIIILGVTDSRAPAGFAPLAIGLALTLIHLISIPVTNTSVNPARSTGQAIFVGDWALAQLWFFWVMPLIGGALGGIVYRWLGAKSE
jgi:aquaporin Z